LLMQPVPSMPVSVPGRAVQHIQPKWPPVESPLYSPEKASEHGQSLWGLEFARRIKGRLAPLEGRLHMGVSQVRADRMFKG